MKKKRDKKMFATALAVILSFVLLFWFLYYCNGLVGKKQAAHQKVALIIPQPEPVKVKEADSLMSMCFNGMPFHIKKKAQIEKVERNAVTLDDRAEGLGVGVATVICTPVCPVEVETLKLYMYNGRMVTQSWGNFENYGWAPFGPKVILIEKRKP